MEEQKRKRGRPRKNLETPVVATKKNKVTRKKNDAVVVEAEQDAYDKPKGYSVQMRGGKPVKVEDTDEVE